MSDLCSQLQELSKSEAQHVVGQEMAIVDVCFFRDKLSAASAEVEWLL